MPMFRGTFAESRGPFRAGRIVRPCSVGSHPRLFTSIRFADARLTSGPSAKVRPAPLRADGKPPSKSNVSFIEFYAVFDEQLAEFFAKRQLLVVLGLGFDVLDNRGFLVVRDRESSVSILPMRERRKSWIVFRSICWWSSLFL